MATDLETPVDEQIESEAVEQQAEEVAVEETAEPTDAERRLKAIEEANLALEEAERVVNNCKADLKEAKAEYEGKARKLSRLIREGMEDYPLFDHFEEPAKPDDSWRKADIVELGLTKGKLDKLRELGLNTIGELEDFRAGNDGLSSIDGFGPKAIDQIEEAIASWLDKNRDRKPAVEEPMSPDEADEIADSIRQAITGYEFPDEALEFLQSVENGLEGVIETIEKTNTVTPDQARALRNWRDGVGKWIS